MIKRIQTHFIYSVGVMLFVAAFFTLLATTSPAQTWDRADSLLGIPCRWVFYLFGFENLALSAYLFCGRNENLNLALIVWSAFNFAAYYFGLNWYGGANLFCCMGNVTGLVPVSPWVLNWVINVFLGIQIGGSCLLLVGNKIVQPKATNAKANPAHSLVAES